ncbi:hypothetical protein BC939DRAFT_475590 [Gamsiella multidivaricata]|uniref:uncharacterized protein n=1 Tax=Gamsiella multidivaricata TaxID=101098 RepID=UPI00221FBB77|nr:uncharacterized protein BC939DRAFT_475590 [Gamsiella multidivaricata]KAI7826903.1 hypothetical protein BC939DRAFT_475590 [Gamsiella multidivaricata]
MANPTAETACPSQTFRISLLSKAPTAIPIINIGTRLDRKTGQYVILWTDIQRVFEGAQYIMDRDSAVLLMTDDDFQELAPPRILHCPGTVLDVVLRDSAQELPSEIQAGPALHDTDDQRDLRTNNRNTSHAASDNSGNLHSAIRYILECRSLIQGTLQTITDRVYESEEGLPGNAKAIKPKAIAMDLPEIRNYVFQHLDRRDFVKCMLLNKKWHDWAAPKVWETARLSGIPRNNLSVEALRRYSHLVKTFRIDNPASVTKEYYDMYLIKLEKLILVVPNGHLVDTLHVCDFIYRHTYLVQIQAIYQKEDRYSFATAQLEARKAFEQRKREPYAVCQLWETIASLPNLRTLHVWNFPPPFSTFEFLSVRALYLECISSSSGTFPSLETLEWFPGSRGHFEDPVPELVEMFKAGTWLKLERFGVDRHYLKFSDTDIASILAAMPRVVAFSVSSTAEHATMEVLNL